MSLHDISQQIAELTRRVTVLKTNRSSLPVESDRTPTSSTYTSNVTTHWHTLAGRDSVREPNELESSLTDTPHVAETSEVATSSSNYIYYRIYADDGAIPSKTPVTPGDLFLGRIKARSVPPPRNVEAVKRSIANVENIKHRERTSLFLTAYSELPLDDARKVIIIKGADLGSTPQEPLALVATMSNSERLSLESDGRGALASTAEAETTPPDTKYVYYVLFVDDYEMPSKVAFDPEEPSLGRIRVDSVTPPHSLTSIKRCISRVERNPGLARANLFANTSCDTPMKEGQISLLRTDIPGLSPNEPMAIVLSPPIRRLEDGKYSIKNRAVDIYWSAGHNPIKTVYFFPTTMENVRNYNSLQWDITHDTDGNIFMTSPYAPSSWVGSEITGSKVPVPWRLIPADNESYYLTTDINFDSQNPRVPAAEGKIAAYYGKMATLKEGDQCQMWEFIPI